MSDQEPVNLRGMTRADLNDYATAHGIADAEGYANKDELAAAIESAYENEVPPKWDEGTEAAGDEEASAGDEADAEDGGNGGYFDDATAAAANAAGADDEADDEAGATYHVLKAFTLDDGRTVMPGDEFDPATVEKWPARRAKQMVDQKFMKETK